MKSKKKFSGGVDLPVVLSKYSFQGQISVLGVVAIISWIPVIRWRTQHLQSLYSIPHCLAQTYLLVSLDFPPLLHKIFNSNNFIY